MDALARAAQLQRRLIAEHACRIYPHLREAKRSDGLIEGIELAIELPRDEPREAAAQEAAAREAAARDESRDEQAAAAYHPLPACTMGDVTPAELQGCGFAGRIPIPEAGKKAAGGIYAEFAAGGNPAYNRQEVSTRIGELLAQDDEAAAADDAAGFTLFAWRNCGFCTKARKELDARGLKYRMVVLDKYSAEHAELAMETGRLSVPYVFDRAGALLGGYDADERYPGLAGTLAAYDAAAAAKQPAATRAEEEEEKKEEEEAEDERSSMRSFAEAHDETLPEAYFRDIDYASGGVPWDLLGRPQPPVRNAFDEGAFGARGTVILDCGCGAGDNANWLAARGHDVLGFDISESAVQTARARAASADVAKSVTEAGGATEYVMASAIDLAAAERVHARAAAIGGFEVALDSAMLHCLGDDAQAAFVEGVRPLMRPGGKLFVGCFSDANPDPWSNPRRISEAQLRSLLSEERGWRVTSLSSAWYERPSERAASNRGAWSMAWWCVAEAV